MPAKTRIAWIDVVRYICMILVMSTHVDAKADVFRTFYLPFVLIGFFFSAGYVYRPGKPFKEYISRKIRQLFIPWLIFSVGNILLAHVISFNEHAGLLTELGWNMLQIRTKGDELWFIAAIFVAYIPFYFFVKWFENQMSKGRPHTTALAVCISWMLSLLSYILINAFPEEAFPWGVRSLPWHTDYMFQAMFYMFLGYLYRKEWEETCEKKLTAVHRTLLWILYLVIVFVPYFLGITFTSIPHFFYNDITAVLGTFNLCLLARHIPSNRYISYVGRNTLIYFALHGKACSVIQAVLKKVAPAVYELANTNAAFGTVYSVAFSLFLSVILFVPAYIINHYLPFIVGRKNRK